MNVFKNIIHRIKPKKSRTIPHYDMKIAFLNTVEGCCLFAASRESIYAGVKAVFYTLSPEVQYMLIFSPKAGEWTARAQFWRDTLREALPEKQYYLAMSIILKWYIHCVKNHKKKEACNEN